jgi:cytochrome c oxidase subunit 2
MRITGHQWWWEVRYANGAYGANEIHIPAGVRVPVWILGADVIHDFWVPELGPKVDAIPGRTTALWLEAERPGTYLGACAEYCGTEHAWMLIRVIAQPAAEYQDWLAAQAAAPATPGGADASHGAQLFRERTCINCHAIQGTEATARVGPDLSHVAARETLGSGVVRNTAENLARWIADPNRIKPGVLMPNLKLTPDDNRAIAAYLETLR